MRIEDLCPALGTGEWIAKWTTPAEMTYNPDAVEWVRSRPPSVQALMRRLPPSCVVRSSHPYMCPPVDGFAIINSYFEDGETVSVIAHPDGRTAYHCAAEHLTAVGYHAGITPEWIARALDKP